MSKFDLLGFELSKLNSCFLPYNHNWLSDYLMSFVAVTAEQLCFTFRSLQEASSRHLWPRWLRPWKTSTAQMKSVTRLQIQTPFQGQRRTHWPLHTGTSSIHHDMFTVLCWHVYYRCYCTQTNILHTNNANIDKFLLMFFWSRDIYLSFLYLCFCLRAPTYIRCMSAW